MQMVLGLLTREVLWCMGLPTYFIVSEGQLPQICCLLMAATSAFTALWPSCKYTTPLGTGNDAFALGNISSALGHYSKALQEEPRNAVLLSNRAACYLAIKW